jgi:hypothetical protein
MAYLQREFTILHEQLRLRARCITRQKRAFPRARKRRILHHITPLGFVGIELLAPGSALPVHERVPRRVVQPEFGLRRHSVGVAPCASDSTLPTTGRSSTRRGPALHAAKAVSATEGGSAP